MDARLVPHRRTGTAVVYFHQESLGGGDPVGQDHPPSKERGRVADQIQRRVPAGGRGKIHVLGFAVVVADVKAAPAEGPIKSGRVGDLHGVHGVKSVVVQRDGRDAPAGVAGLSRDGNVGHGHPQSVPIRPLGDASPGEKPGIDKLVVVGVKIRHHRGSPRDVKLLVAVIKRGCVAAAQRGGPKDGISARPHRQTVIHHRTPAHRGDGSADDIGHFISARQNERRVDRSGQTAGGRSRLPVGAGKVRVVLPFKRPIGHREHVAKIQVVVAAVVGRSVVAVNARGAGIPNELFAPPQSRSTALNRRPFGKSRVQSRAPTPPHTIVNQAQRRVVQLQGTGALRFRGRAADPVLGHRENVRIRRREMPPRRHPPVIKIAADAGGRRVPHGVNLPGNAVDHHRIGVGENHVGALKIIGAADGRFINPTQFDGLGRGVLPGPTLKSKTPAPPDGAGKGQGVTVVVGPKVVDLGLRQKKFDVFLVKARRGHRVPHHLGDDGAQVVPYFPGHLPRAPRLQSEIQLDGGDRRGDSNVRRDLGVLARETRLHAVYSGIHLQLVGAIGSGVFTVVVAVIASRATDVGLKNIDLDAPQGRSQVVGDGAAKNGRGLKIQPDLFNLGRGVPTRVTVFGPNRGHRDAPHVRLRIAGGRHDRERLAGAVLNDFFDQGVCHERGGTDLGRFRRVIHHIGVQRHIDARDRGEGRPHEQPIDRGGQHSVERSFGQLRRRGSRAGTGHADADFGEKPGSDEEHRRQEGEANKQFHQGKSGSPGPKKKTESSTTAARGAHGRLFQAFKAIPSGGIMQGSGRGRPGNGNRPEAPLPVR